MKSYRLIMFVLIGIFLSLLAKPANLTTVPTNAIILWNNAALQAIVDTYGSFPPAIAVRSLAIMHTGIFDAWAAYDPVAVGTQLGGTLRRPEGERTLNNKNKAISFAAHRTLVDLFPSQKTKFNNLMASLGYDTTESISTNTSTAAGIGNVVAQALLDSRRYDGSNQLGNLSASGIPYSDYTGYTPVNTPDTINDPNRWQPLRVSDGNGGFIDQEFDPLLGLITPFALTSSSQLLPTPPKTLTYDPYGFKQQAQQILDYSANLTDEQKVIGEFWASRLPPSQWNLFAQFVSQRDDHGVDDDAKMFFVLNNALLDAGIASWNTKLTYDSVRPITAIHYLFKGQIVKAWGGPNQGTQLINGEDWQPYLLTPPFPEYTAGHSAFSAAGAEILKRFTGSDAFGASFTKPAGTSGVETGPATDITLSWATFSDAADQAGISRRYGGAHFEDGDLVGKSQGRQAADLVWRKAQSYISQTWNNYGQSGQPFNYRGFQLSEVQ